MCDTRQQSVIELMNPEDGTVPAVAWPGMYPIYYITADCGTLCPKCVNDNIKTIVDETLDDSGEQWQLIGLDVNWEDDTLICDNCNEWIVSAYGDRQVSE